MGHLHNSDKRSTPSWMVFVLSGVVLLVTAAVCITLLLCFHVINCGPAETGTPEEASAENVPPQGTELPPEATTAAQPAAQTPDVTEEPEEIITEVRTPEPTEAPTAEPTAEPTATLTPTPTPTPKPTPTATPTPKPTAVPDSFTFGGKKVKTGVKKINGKDLGINGSKKKLTHITAEEVQNLIVLCPDLEELVLDYCYMDDYAPLGNLTKLRNLKLASCGANGGNSVDGIEWVKGLNELRTLNLVHNKVGDTSPLGGLKNLTYLNLSDNPLTDEDLVPIGKLTNLETLYLNNLYRITDVKPLSALTKLTFLDIGANSKLKDVKPLTSLKKIQYLRIHYTKVSDLSGFNNFAALKKLDLTKCPIDTKTIKNLKSCKKLKTIVLEMGDTDIYYAVLDQLINEGHEVLFQYNW